MTALYCDLRIVPLVLLIFCEGSLCLRNVSLTIEPKVVEWHKNAILRCSYDLEETPLYSVKWYRGQHEFYRYTPAEHPPTKIFPYGGIMVDVSGIALRDVSVVVPQAATIGDTVTLQCRFDLEGEPLYTVKWYKGGREFYRFIPKELPNTQVFPYQDIDVDLAKSNQKSIVLRSLRPEHTGRYKCEVSSDAPNFYTRMESSFMYVVSMPEGKPEMYIEKDSYELGYTVRGNCTSPPSYPPLNLTWMVNHHQVNASYITRLPDLSSNDGKKVVTVVGLELEIDGNTFQGGKAMIRCSADLFHLYHAEEEDTLVEERPRPNPSSVLGTRESSSGRRTSCGVFLMNISILLHALIIR